ncbi:hypothetical protein A2U01_0008599 [Trifolium medium]|uniref:Uncharacterized protein n=1 Tax=Trifolium medium TaxID=97028 RepID=A0A392MK37_9FABA|nr:hypothetical protein [Trifolium medium]
MAGGVSSPLHTSTLPTFLSGELFRSGSVPLRTGKMKIFAVLWSHHLLLWVVKPPSAPPH